MQRYFILEKENWSENQVMINGSDVHHIYRVMRKAIGDQIICNDNEGRVALCTISEITNNQVVAIIEEWLKQDVELPIDVTIAQGLPKGDKLDFILQKGTELGAQVFVPFKAERSIVQWDDKKLHKKMQRFEKIVKEASEQSHRSRIPVIEQPVHLQELLQYSLEYDYKLFAYEEAAKTEEFQSFAAVLKQMNKGMRILICIGPEGGFSDQEASILQENNFHAVRFGPRILRTETAGLYALASISYHFEELAYNE